MSDPATDIQIDQIVALLASGITPAVAAEAARSKMGVADDQADDAVEVARQKIMAAAETNREGEAGMAYVRLHALYKAAITGKDLKTALAAQRELNKLLSLYPGAGDDEPVPVDDTGDPAATLQAIADHLLPLGLAPSDYPIVEHARIAAATIRDAIVAEQQRNSATAQKTPPRLGKGVKGDKGASGRNARKAKK